MYIYRQINTTGEHLPAVRLSDCRYFSFKYLMNGENEMSIYLPVAVVVLSNTVYHICSKSVPGDADPFAALSVTYAVGTVASLLLYFITQKGGSLLQEYRHLNWSSFVLGLAIIGLEAGFLWMYRTGWNISTGQIVSSAVLAVVLVFIGCLLYREALTLSRVAGIAVCIAGIYLISR